MIVEQSRRQNCFTVNDISIQNGFQNIYQCNISTMPIGWVGGVKEGVELGWIIFGEIWENYQRRKGRSYNNNNGVTTEFHSQSGVDIKQPMAVSLILNTNHKQICL